MNPSDVFKVTDPKSISRERMLEDYWELEILLSDENSNAFSYVDLQDPLERTCAICLRVNNTNDGGAVPHLCEYEICNDIRSFWNIHGNITRFSNFGYSKSNRYTFLKNRMKSILGVNNLSDISQEIRFEFLFNAMLERMAHEHSKND